MAAAMMRRRQPAAGWRCRAKAGCRSPTLASKAEQTKAAKDNRSCHSHPSCPSDWREGGAARGCVYRIHAPVRRGVHSTTHTSTHARSRQLFVGLTPANGGLRDEADPQLARVSDSVESMNQHDAR